MPVLAAVEDEFHYARHRVRAHIMRIREEMKRIDDAVLHYDAESADRPDDWTIVGSLGAIVDHLSETPQIPR